MIIGSDVFSVAPGVASKIRGISTAKEGSRQFLTVEIGSPNSGVRFVLPLMMAAELAAQENLNATMELEVIPRLEDLWESPKQLTAVDRWLKGYHQLDADDVSTQLLTAPKAGVNLNNDGCPCCSTTHVNRGEHAKNPHHTHTCGFCRYHWKRGVAAVCNPLQIFNPVLEDGKTVLQQTIALDEALKNLSHRVCRG